VNKYAVGVIGLGNMGRGIATNLGKHGREVYVWDLAEAARARFKDKPGFIIAPQGEMAKHCEAIFFLVPATPEITA
jgi:3-hydroxyisobutyrate dehydrogenase-like beta-hydroxyacid dehydrogenase